jgi:hypothetical protein
MAEVLPRVVRHLVDAPVQAAAGLVGLQAREE